MRKVFIECEAADCLHHDQVTSTCNVTEDTFINVSKDGRCLDYAGLTTDERNAVISGGEVEHG